MIIIYYVIKNLTVFRISINIFYHFVLFVFAYSFRKITEIIIVLSYITKKTIFFIDSYIKII